jgi:hypothetical protein
MTRQPLALLQPARGARGGRAPPPTDRLGELAPPRRRNARGRPSRHGPPRRRPQPARQRSADGRSPTDTRSAAAAHCRAPSGPPMPRRTRSERAARSLLGDTAPARSPRRLPGCMVAQVVIGADSVRITAGCDGTVQRALGHRSPPRRWTSTRTSGPPLRTGPGRLSGPSCGHDRAFCGLCADWRAPERSDLQEQWRRLADPERPLHGCTPMTVNG